MTPNVSHSSNIRWWNKQRYWLTYWDLTDDDILLNIDNTALSNFPISSNGLASSRSHRAYSVYLDEDRFVLILHFIDSVYFYWWHVHCTWHVQLPTILPSNIYTHKNILEHYFWVLFWVCGPAISIKHAILTSNLKRNQNLLNDLICTCLGLWMVWYGMEWNGT